MATLNFNRFNELAAERKLDKEQIAQRKNEIVSDLRNLNTNIQWDSDEFQNKTNEQIFDYLAASQNPVNIDADDPQKIIGRKSIEQAHADIKALEREVKSKDLLDRAGLAASYVIEAVTGYPTQALQEHKQNVSEVIRNAIQAGIEAKDLEVEKNGWVKIGMYSQMRLLDAFKYDAINKEYTKNKESWDLYAKRYKDDMQALQNGEKVNIDAKDLAQMKDRLGFFSHIFKNDDEIVQHFHDVIRAHTDANLATQAVHRLKNVHKSEQFFEAFEPDTPQEKRDEILRDYKIVAQKFGFDDLAYDGKDIYFIKNERAIKITENFEDYVTNMLKANIGTLIFGTAGAILGLVGGWKGLAAGGAAGGFVGGAIDSLLTDAFLDKDFDISQALLHASQEAVYSLAADSAIKALGMGWKATTKAAPQLGNAVTSITDYIPVVSAVKRAFVTGNEQGAKDLVSKAITQEQKQVINEVGELFGMEASIKESKTIETLRSKIDNFFGKESKMAVAANKAIDIFTLKNQRDSQKEFLKLIRADENGSLVKFLANAGNNSTSASIYLQEMLNQTAQKLYRHLSSVGVTQKDFFEILKDYKLSTQDSYNQVMEKTLASVYDDSYKVVVDRAGYDKLRAKMSENIELDEDAMRFLAFLENNLYRKDGVTFTQLSNALKEINKYTPTIKDPSRKDFIESQVTSFLRNDIKENVNKLFEQNPEGAKWATDLFETALKDYHQMLKVFDIMRDLGVQEKGAHAEIEMNKILDYVLGDGEYKGFGQGYIPNLKQITDRVPKEIKPHLEIAVVQSLFMKYLQALDGEIIEKTNKLMFDSSEFFKRLQKLQGLESKEVQNYIDICAKWHDLFKNDAKTWGALDNLGAIPKKVGASIATQPQGAIDHQKTKILLYYMQLGLPTRLVSFLSKDWAERFQAHALQHHLTKALQNGISVSDLKMELDYIARDKTLTLNSETREKLLQIKGDVQDLEAQLLESEAQVLKQAQPATQPLAEFGENFAEFHHNGKAAVGKLMQEQKGQVAGAFEKDGIGEIDLVWGKVTNPAKKEGYGLAHIIDKHANEFAIFGGDTIQEQVGNALNEIISKGHIQPKNNGFNIVLGDFVVGINKGFRKDGQVFGENKWIVTSFDNTADKQGIASSAHLSDITASRLSLANLESNSSTNLSPLQKAQLQKEQAIADKENAQKLADEQFSQKMKAAEKATQENLEAKAANAGLAINDSGIKIGEKIQMRPAGDAGSVSLSDDEIIATKYAIVKVRDLKPQFNSANGLQFRTQADEKTIENIAQNFEPNKIIGRGGFDDLPIIISDGQVISGNHRAKAMQNFTESSRANYKNAIKERLGIELKDDELLVRIADIDESTQAGQRQIINLAMASNANRANKVGDIFVSALGKYDKNIKEMPRILGDEAQNVEQLKLIIAKELDKDAKYPNIDEANKALFASLAKSTNSKNMAEAINLAQEILKNNEADFAKLVNMFADNAGNFRNLVNNIAEMGYKNLEVRPYLTDALIHTAKNLDEGTRKANIAKLASSLEQDIANANANGGIVQNLFGENRQAFNDYIAEALGVALARFVRLENPSANLFEVFKNLEKDLFEKAQPDFFNPNKTPDDVNVLDFVMILLEKGQINESVQKLGASLETLREPYAEFLKGANKAQKAEAKEVAQTATNAEAKAVDSEINPTEIFGEEVEGVPDKLLQKYAQQELENKTGYKKVLDYNRIQDLYSLYRMNQGIIASDEMLAKAYKPKDIERLKKVRASIEKDMNIKPLAEFGENFAEFFADVKGAVHKLAIETKGQVASVATKEIRGKQYSISLVYGDEQKGLKHIIDKHKGEFKRYGDGIDGIAKGMADVIDNAKLYEFDNNKIRLVTDKYMLVLGLREDAQSLVITTFRNRNAHEKLAGTTHTGVASDFTSSTLGVAPSAKQPLDNNITKSVETATNAEAKEASEQVAEVQTTKGADSEVKQGEQVAEKNADSEVKESAQQGVQTETKQTAEQVQPQTPKQRFAQKTQETIQELELKQARIKNPSGKAQIQKQIDKKNELLKMLIKQQGGKFYLKQKQTENEQTN